MMLTTATGFTPMLMPTGGVAPVTHRRGALVPTAV